MFDEPTLRAADRIRPVIYRIVVCDRIEKAADSDVAYYFGGRP